MRNGAALALILASCVAGCGERSDPAAVASEAPAAMEPASTSAAPVLPSDAVPVIAPEADASPVATRAPTSAIPRSLNAIGTEPFWNARIEGARVTYSTPEDQKGRSAAVTRNDTAAGAQFAGKLGGVAVLIEVSRKTCSDGMSDRSYPFTVVLTLGADRREGCAS